ncbi:hypothetical protein [Rudaea sp.]|uniref:hypothetical protein n=1 Tax=Rudaea sp. TaxID=2136325 RepID=UPI0032203D05
MKRIPKLSALFRISDAFAWLVFIVAAYAALSAPFMEFAPPSGAGVATRLPIYFPLLYVVVAFGAFHLTRRHLFGLPLVLLLPIVFENWLATGLYVVIALLVFGTPFMLAFIEARRNIRHVAS